MLLTLLTSVFALQIATLIPADELSVFETSSKDVSVMFV